LAGYVRSLDRLRLRDSSRFGPKAATLGELFRRGFSVPPGFVIAPDGFDKAHNLKIPVQKQVLQAYQRLGAKAVAVRSSSLAEDAPKASSAGQFKTFLNIKNEKELLNAIARCAASGAGAANYLRVLGKGGSAQVAVLVQEMVQADSAGVLFTADPVSGSRDTCVIEAVAGLGDALVSGKVEPSRWVVKRDGAFEESPFRSAPLKNRQVRELVEIGRRIEDVLKKPQDIEWACLAEQMKILQSRPITTIAAGGNIRDVWSNSNVVENLPGVLTPITISTMLAVEKLAHRMLKKIGFPFPDDMRLLAFRAGRGYLNFGAFYMMADMLPGARREEINAVLGGMQEIPEPERTKVSLARKALILIRSLPIVAAFLKLPLVERDSSRRLIRSYYKLVDEDLNKLSDLQLLKRIENWWHVSYSYGKISLPFTSRAFAFWGLLKRLAVYWLDRGAEDLVNRLITGQSGIASTRPVLEIWRLSRTALARKELTEALKFPNPLESLSRTEEGRKFTRELEKMLRQYCYRSDRELDVSVPRLNEDYDAVFSMLRTFLTTPERLGPPAAELRQKRVYVNAVAEARRRLGPLKWFLMKPLVRQARRALAGRDRTKAIGGMAVAGFRLLLLDVGRRLRLKGALDKADDLFFLELEEIFRTLENRLTPQEITALVLRRRRLHNSYFQQSLPDVFVGDINAPVSEAPPAPVGKVLEGMGVSTGRVTGRARVVMGKEDFHKLQAGEILVAPWTDPGWTAIFLLAGGLVADVGGMLSHGSIVAREIGIPAVTNVKRATSTITDGQLITVDGTHGIVELDVKE
jgi:pyruvate,water dikinase